MVYPWQQAQWRQLLADHHHNRLAHALLLGGPSGLGKFYFAEHLAQYLLCTQTDTQAQQACGHCSGCCLVLAKNHPDLITITPEDSKIIKVEQIRRLTAMVAQTAHRAGYQVVILYPAEALNKAAANALLKTLEEPAGAVILLLVSHQPGALPATILSRCQRISFFGYDHPQTLSWLDHELQTLNIRADATLLLKMAEYSPLRALELAKNQYVELRDQLLTHLLAIVQQTMNPIAAVSDYLKQDLELWVNAFISLLMDMVRLQLGVQPSLLVNHDRLTQLGYINQAYPLSALLGLITQLQQARQWLLNQSVHVNIQLLLEDLFIRLMEIRQCNL